MKYDALLVTKPENVFYLTRFPMPEDARVLVARRTRGAKCPLTPTLSHRGEREHALILFTDTRYLEEIAPLAEKGIEVKITDQPHPLLYKEGKQRGGRGDGSLLALTLKEYRVRTLGVEGGHMPVETFLRLGKQMKNLGVKIASTHDVIEKIRIVKTKQEIDCIARACRISADAIKKTMPRIRAGMRENAVAWMLEKTIRELGADGPAFPFIVASGARGAHPHGIASEKRIEKGELVTIDFGARIAGYHSDMTRTFFMRKNGRLKNVEESREAPAEIKKIYQIVKCAQSAGMHAVRSGRACSSIDRVAREVIARAGYGKYFVHSTGHGVGLEIHEAPTISAKSKDRLLENMVVTVEPGVYIPGVGGVRIEDTLAVTRTGYKKLTL